MKLFKRDKIAKNSMPKIDQKVYINKNREDTVMSEKRVTKPEAEEATEKPATPKKAASSKKEEPEKKENIFKRAWKCIKRNRKYIYVGAGSAIVGAGATYGVGKFGEHMANKRAAQHQNDNSYND